MQEIDVMSRLSTSYEAQRPSVSLADSVVKDPKEVSETIRNLDQARAVSQYMKVKLWNEDWTDEQIEEEVKRIREDESTELPDPFSVGA